jgi:hypothetical protein
MSGYTALGQLPILHRPALKMSYAYVQPRSSVHKASCKTDHMRAGSVCGGVHDLQASIAGQDKYAGLRVSLVAL